MFSCSLFIKQGKVSLNIILISDFLHYDLAHYILIIDYGFLVEKLIFYYQML